MWILTVRLNGLRGSAIAQGFGLSRGLRPNKATSHFWKTASFQPSGKMNLHQVGSYFRFGATFSSARLAREADCVQIVQAWNAHISKETSHCSLLPSCRDCSSEAQIIMVTITEVLLKDAERAYQEFFREEFRSQRVGSFGYWLGRAQHRLNLENPVSQSTFQNLVHGLAPDGIKRILEEGEKSDRIALWQVEVRAPQSLSSLWAVAPGTWRGRLESAHMTAAWDTLQKIQAAVDIRQTFKPPENRAATLSVFFSQGAGHNQNPELKTTAFILAHGFRPDGSARKLDGDAVPAQKEFAQYVYSRAISSDLSELIGPFRKLNGSQEIAAVPKELVRKFFVDPSFHREQRPPFHSKPLAESELFIKWRTQGESVNWGVNQAKELLRVTHRRKYWADLKKDVQARFNHSVSVFKDWKTTWKQSGMTPSQRPEQNPSEQQGQQHRHRH